MALLESNPMRLGALLLLSGCSLALDLDEQIPCSSDAQCMYAAGQGSCENGFCTPPSEAGTETDTTVPTTDTTTDTTDDPTTQPTSPTSPTTDPSTTTEPDTTTEPTTTGPTGCAVNSDCTMDQRCGSGGTCVDLLSTECQEVVWPDDRDNVVFLGSIMPTSEPFTALVQPLENAVRLAVQDFNDETRLQGDREIAWVRCDDSVGSEASVAAAQHLVDDVGVPAIVGPLFSENVLAVAEQVTIDAGVFLMTPSASAMSIADLADQDLVWRTIPGDVYQSNALVDRMIDLDGDDPITQLLILAKDDAYGNGVLSAILPELEMALGADVVEFATYPNPTEFDSMKELQTAYATVLAGVAGQAPYSHVIFVGTSEIQLLLYSYLGYVWEPGVDPMPLFTVTHGAVPELERFINEIGLIPGTEPLEPLKPVIEANLQGTTPIVLNPTNFGAFSLRYQIAFNDEEPLTSAALSYDSALATIFAMCTVPGDEDVTGAAIAAAMPRLVDPDGTDVSFSGSDISFISDARNVLVVAGGAVDLQGVSGELQWDLTTGDVREGVWGWDVCDPTVDGSMPDALFTRIYTLDAAPSTEGTWSVLQPCP